MRAFAKAVLLSALSLVLYGCGTGAKGECPALSSCGGEPSGNWKIANVCQYGPVRPSQPTDIGEFLSGAAPTLAPPQPNPVLPVQNTSGDWCSSLVYPSDGTITNAVLWHDPPLLVSGQIAFTAVDHSYTSTYTFTTPVGPGDLLAPGARNTTHFAPSCLVANGGKSMADPALPPTCAELSAALTKFYSAQQVPAYSDIQCGVAADSGCDCSYLFQLVVADAGSWSVSGSSLLQTSSLITFNGQEAKTQAPAQTLEASYCAQHGVALQLSGANGSSLNGLLGLRSLTLSPM